MPGSIPAEDCSDSYKNGCRCQACRDVHAALARARRRRKREGTPGQLDRVGIGPTAAALERMRSDGLTLFQIEELTGIDRRDLTRIRTQLKVAVLTAERVATGYERYLRYGPPTARLQDRTATRWMLDALLARGWTMRWIANHVGNQAKLGLRGPKVQQRTVERVTELFHEHHDQWGPRRMVAVRSWRNGHFFSDCYEWERGDQRPIPGSLHPDLVAEALTFTRFVPMERQSEIRRLLHACGQWETARCARTSMAAWLDAMGYEPEDYVTEPVGIAREGERGVFCQNPRHDHSLPECWQVDSIYADTET